jgi:cell division protein FtsB
MNKNFFYHFVKKYQISKALFVSYFVACFSILYFGFFIVFGEKGLLKLATLSKQIQNEETAKKEICAKLQVKKNMVDGMNLNSLDIDLLDEQARKVLGYAGKNEVIIYQDSSTNK